MCGRYAYRASDFDYPGMFGTRPGEELADRYNVAPTQPMPIVRATEDGSREVAVVRWGLVPAWVKDPAGLKLSLFNARAEGVAEKPSFRAAFRSRRCLVPVSGFYEWQKVDGAKQPWFITRADGKPTFFAGLWESWGKGEERLESGTIITTGPNAEMAGLHHRMPVVLEEDEFDVWLDHGPEEVLDAAPDGTLSIHRVSTRVNNARNQGPELTLQVE